MKALHVFDVTGDVLFRRDGDESRLIPCKVIQTRGLVTQIQDGFNVLILDLASGFVNYNFDHWIKNWNEEVDNVSLLSGRNVYDGKRFSVAYNRTAFDSVMETGKNVRQTYVDAAALSTSHSKDGYKSDREDLCAHPILAVLIDGLWVEPTSMLGVAR